MHIIIENNQSYVPNCFMAILESVTYTEHYSYIHIKYSLLNDQVGRAE